MGKLKSWFGDDREEIWRKLASEMGGRYVAGGAWKGDKVHIDHGEWTMTLDVYSVHANNVTTFYTRLRAPFVNAEGFRFSIHDASFFSKIGKWFGMQDVEVGDPEFDERFIIKGTHEPRLRELFADEKIRRLITAQPAIRLSIVDDEGWFGPTYPEGTDALMFVSHGIVTDEARLRALYELFAETLDQLCRMGSAYATDPGLEL